MADKLAAFDEWVIWYIEEAPLKLDYTDKHGKPCTLADLYPEQYAYIPESLAERLKKATADICAVYDEIESYRKLPKL